MFGPIDPLLVVNLSSAAGTADPRGMRRTGPRPERGVTLVEYALFLGGFVLVAVTAVGGLNGSARTYFHQAGSRIGEPANRIVYDENGNRQQQASTTTITAPPSTAPPTTTTPPATTTPTTTTPPTTQAPTTTLPAPTTTAAPRRVSTSISNTSYSTGHNTWTFRVTITVTGTGGASVNNLDVSAVSRFWGFPIASLGCTTSWNGTCTITYPGVSSFYSPITFEISGVSGSAQWTGSTRSITIYAP